MKEEIRKILYKNSHDDSECLRIKFENIDQVLDQIMFIVERNEQKEHIKEIMKADEKSGLYDCSVGKAFYKKRWIECTKLDESRPEQGTRIEFWEKGLKHTAVVPPYFVIKYNDPFS